MKHICDYGCGQEAKYQFKNGKWCCSEYSSQCPAMRKKMSGENHPFYRKHHSEKTKQKMCENQSGENNPMYGKHPSKESIEKRAKKLRTPFEGVIKFTEDEDYELLSKEEDYKNQFSYLWFKCLEGHKCKIRWDSFKAGYRCRKCADKKHSQWMKINGQVCPNYNPKACKRMDEYGDKNGYNFQHAENGGEYHIKELGYYVDGYDKEKNVVIEVDEFHHFDKDGNLREKDVQRQKEIIDFLGCEFIRLKI